MDKKLLDILACPVCKGSLVYKETQEELHCVRCRLVYPIFDNIPVLLKDEAKPLIIDNG
ncbi:MAG: Trm112 family protein [Gammaproteobacteria bacterium]|nr:Trm112 family protein [Gammaproteobacteria bacterium]